MKLEDLKEYKVPGYMKEVGGESKLLKKADKSNQYIIKTAQKLLGKHINKGTDFGVQGKGSGKTGPTYYTSIKMKKGSKLTKTDDAFREFQQALKSKLGKDFNRMSLSDSSIVVIYYARPKE